MENSAEEPPARLLPEAWVERFEATERPNQAFLRPGLSCTNSLWKGKLSAARVGAELEQWFAEAIERVFHACALCRAEPR